MILYALKIPSVKYSLFVTKLLKKGLQVNSFVIK